MRDEAAFRVEHVGGSRTLPIVPVGYEQFREMAFRASQEIARGGATRRGVVAIPRLRRALRHVPTATFNEHLLRLERNDVVYLIPPESPETLADDDRRECLAHPAGDLRSFVLWMGPKPQTAGRRD
jgi:hypothetical protein